MFASGGADGTVRIWEPATGKPKRAFAAHPSGVTALAVRPDGLEVASAGADGRVRVWPLRDADRHRSLKLSAPGFAVAVGPGGTAVVGALDGSVVLFDPATGKERKRLTGHAAGVAAMCAVGDRLATGGGDTVVKLWDVTAGTATDLAGHTGTVLALAADGDRLISGAADGTVRGWSLPAGKPLWTWPAPAAVCAVAVLPGRRLAVGTADGTLTLLDTSSEPKPLGDAVAHSRAVLSVAVSPDGSRVATSGGDGVARLWTPSAGGPVPAGRIDPTAKTPPPAHAVAFDPTGRLLAVAAGDAVRLWDVTQSAERRTLRGHTDAVTAVAFSPDGSTVVTAAADGTARAFPLPRADGRPTAHAGPVTAVAVSPDGKTVLTGSADGTAKLWKADTGAEFGSVRGADLGAVGFGPKGEPVLAVFGGPILILEPNGREAFRRLPSGPVFAAGLAPDGAIAAAWIRDGQAGFDLFPPGATSGKRTPAGEATCGTVSAAATVGVTGSADGTVRVWNLRTGERAGADWRLVEAPLVDVQLTADEATLAVLDANGGLRLGDLAKRTVTATLAAPGAVGLAVTSGKVAAYSADGLVVLFAGGKEVRRWPMPAGVRSAAFGPDGKVLVVGAADGSAHMLDLP